MDPLTLIVVILLVRWLTGYAVTGAALIHVLLVVVLVLVIVRLLKGRTL